MLFASYVLIIGFVYRILIKLCFSDIEKKIRHNQNNFNGQNVGRILFMFINYQAKIKEIIGEANPWPPIAKKVITIIEKVRPKILANRVTDLFGDIRRNNGH